MLLFLSLLAFGYLRLVIDPCCLQKNSYWQEDFYDFASDFLTTRMKSSMPILISFVLSPGSRLTFEVPS